MESRVWGQAGELPAGDLARMLGTYARLVITPRGTVAVTGEELMTSLRPPTKAKWSQDEGKYVSAKVPHTLHTLVDPAPPGAPTNTPSSPPTTGRKAPGPPARPSTRKRASGSAPPT